MSVVAGLIKDGKVYMAADSMSSSDDGDIRYRADKKIFVNDKYIIGYTGSARTGQVLKPHYFKPPKNIYDLPDAIREQLKEKGCSCEIPEAAGTDAMGSNLLIGWKGKLYEVLIDFQLVELVEPYSAVGAGKYHALSVFYFANRIGLFDEISPPDLLQYAIETASYFCASVGGEIEYEMM